MKNEHEDEDGEEEERWRRSGRRSLRASWMRGRSTSFPTRQQRDSDETAGAAFVAACCVLKPLSLLCLGAIAREPLLALVSLARRVLLSLLLFSLRFREIYNTINIEIYNSLNIEIYK
jgi:hypothetical protein